MATRILKHTIFRSFAGFTALLLLIGLGGAVSAQRMVDQGRGAGTNTADQWVFRITDSTGTRFASLETTGTPGVFALVISGGTGGGGSTAVSVTSGTIGLITMPALTVTSATIGSMPALSVTNSQTIGLITMPSLTFTSGTVGSMPVLNIGTFSPTVTVTGTVQNNGGTVTATPTGTTTVAGTLTGVTGTFTANQGAASATGWPVTQSGAWGVTASAGTGTFNVTFTNTAIQANAGTGTMNTTFTNTAIQANAGTGTFNVDDIANGTIGSAVPTNGMFNAGVVRTDTIAKGSAGNMIGLQLDNQGRLVVVSSPPEMGLTATGIVTATTASSIAGAAPGANYKWAIESIFSCNLSGVVATQLDITDSTGTIVSFPWTQTATTAGEPRCYLVQFTPDPYLTAANSTISVKLTTSDATGVRTVITGHKTTT